MTKGVSLLNLLTSEIKLHINSELSHIVVQILSGHVVNYGLCVETLYHQPVSFLVQKSIQVRSIELHIEVEIHIIFGPNDGEILNAINVLSYISYIHIE